MIDILENACKLTKQISETALDKNEFELQTVSTQLAKAIKLKRSLFLCEKNAIDTLEKDISELSINQDKLQKLIKFGKQFKLLSLEPLSWRDEDGFPLLIFFDLESHISVIGVQRKHWAREPAEHLWQFGPILPKILKDCYADVITTLHKKICSVRFHDKDLYMKIECEFNGVIPEDIRNKIIDVKDSFEEIYLICAPEKWKLDTSGGPEQKSSIDSDPLVVGWDGFNLWLIAVFDLTSIETAMLFPILKPKDEK